MKRHVSFAIYNKWEWSRFNSEGGPSRDSLLIAVNPDRTVCNITIVQHLLTQHCNRDGMQHKTAETPEIYKKNSFSDSKHI